MEKTTGQFIRKKKYCTYFSPLGSHNHNHKHIHNRNHQQQQQHPHHVHHNRRRLYKICLLESQVNRLWH